jgi:hypothetical protein
MDCAQRPQQLHHQHRVTATAPAAEQEHGGQQQVLLRWQQLQEQQHMHLC